MKKISVLGSTGSIGTQTLEVVDRQGEFEVTGLTANTNIKSLENQIRKYRPKKSAIADLSLYKTLKDAVKDTNTVILAGTEGISEVGALTGADIVVSALVGISGLIPTLAAIDEGIDIALANKETLVTAGEIVIKRVKEKQVKLLPVDSEHCAIFQCLNSLNADKHIKRLILTASGGPFYGLSKDQLKNINPQDALNHPNWSMGNKITIDSATLMNKGLEIIEAKWLFDVCFDQIDVVVHKQSIIHSMVEFSDNSILAQMGFPDMKTPISFALNYPNRENANLDPFDFIKHNTLTFGYPDEDTFSCLKLAKKALKIGGTMTSFLNGANEIAVDLFLKNKIKFLEIPILIDTAMRNYTPIFNYNLNDVINADKLARQAVIEQIGG